MLTTTDENILKWVRFALENKDMINSYKKLQDDFYNQSDKVRKLEKEIRWKNTTIESISNYVDRLEWELWEITCPICYWEWWFGDWTWQEECHRCGWKWKITLKKEDKIT
jgi:hypothetical protein